MFKQNDQPLPRMEQLVSIETERSVLSSIIQSPQLFWELSICGKDFIMEEHRTILKVIDEIMRDGCLADASWVMKSLNRHNCDGKVFAALDEVLEATAYHRDEVKKMARRLVRLREDREELARLSPDPYQHIKHLQTLPRLKEGK